MDSTPTDPRDAKLYPNITADGLIAKIEIADSAMDEHLTVVDFTNDEQDEGIANILLALEDKLDIPTDTLELPTFKTPAAANATGTKGDICIDADYIYVCVATDTWKRAAIATWGG